MSSTRTRPHRNATRTPSSALRRLLASYGDPTADPYTDPWLETWLKVTPDPDAETFDALRRRRQLQAASVRPPETPEHQLVGVRVLLERLDAERARVVSRRDALVDQLIESGFSVRGRLLWLACRTSQCSSDGATPEERNTLCDKRIHPNGV